jgi:hypothetical protein
MSHARGRPLGPTFLRLAAVGASVALLFGAMVPAATAKSNAASHTTQQIHRVGVAHMPSAGTATTPSGSLSLEGRPAAQQDTDAETAGPKSSAHVASAHVPQPATLPVQDASSGFAGLNHYDNRTAGTGDYANTQFSLEPPDQGLCVSDNGTIVETVNTVVRVRNSSGASLTGAIALNQFFGLDPEVIRPATADDSAVYGQFTSDPKCYWDPDTGHWFLTLLEIDVNSATGGFLPHAHQLLAVSETTNPAGDWWIYSWDTTDDGSNGVTHSGCPCFGDQPLLGADANGIYISTNEYPIFAAGFNGANIYAISKSALVGGDMSTQAFLFNEPTLAEGYAYSVQPATTAHGASYAPNTEYFLSALEFTGRGDNRIALWAMTDTDNLSAATPSAPTMLDPAIVRGAWYNVPPTVLQKNGDTPLKDLLNTQPALSETLGLIAHPVHEHLNLLNANDDRMNQVVWDGTTLWGAVNTVVKSSSGANGTYTGTRSGIAYFGVAPSVDGSTVSGDMAQTGYVAVRNNSVFFPSIAANANGDAAIVFTLAGQDYYPSAAYVTLNATTKPTAVKVAKYGLGPADGFTGYPSQDPVDNGVERWGDYSAAVADSSGAIWMATETVNQSCTLAEFASTGFTCDNTRTIYANWGTWIANVTP